LDPAGLTKLGARFWWWFTISGLASLTPMPLRRHLARWLDSPAMLEPEMMAVMWAGSRGYRMEPKFPGVLTDDELRAIDVPVLLITGARSAMLTPAEARARGGLMPHAEVAVVPGSHGGFNRIDELNDRVAAFIETQADGSTTRLAGAQGQAGRRLDLAQPQVGHEPLAAADGQGGQHLLELGDVAGHRGEQVVHLAGHRVCRGDLRRGQDQIVEPLAGVHVVPGQRGRHVDLEREAQGVRVELGADDADDA
ncbi:MAG TPA: alpha/beta hydrolase, partial [Streptosporangiaceae bacterium]